MFSRVLSADVKGVQGYGVFVESDVSEGLPVFLMVGYLASEVKEAGDRVRSALRNIGVRLPAKRVVINLTPAGVRKAGSRFDLAIAITILTSLGILREEETKGILFAGELSLNGEVLGVSGVLPMVEAAKEMGCTICMVPKRNAKEGALIPNIQVFGVGSLKECVEILKGEKQGKEEVVDIQKLLEQGIEEEKDFSDICGQEVAKRAVEVAVSGMHNLLMVGTPGAGKTMLASRIPSILPPLTMEESLEISKLYSITGLLSKEEYLLKKRPFRSPHHTISASALAGGGRIPIPGEISLSSRGVLFLDELPEFNQRALEVLRQPLEEKIVRLVRTTGTYEYPAHFMLVAAMNPCKCGYYPDRNRCHCTQGEVEHYLNKVSGPLLDRMDLAIEVPEVGYETIKNTTRGESSKSIRKRVVEAHEIQKERYRADKIYFNAQLSEKKIEEYCRLGMRERNLLEEIFRKRNLSMRAYHRLMKVSRTIADLEGEKSVEEKHILEAVCYRMPKGVYWKG